MLIVDSNEGVMSLRGGGRTSSFKQNIIETGGTEVSCKTCFWIYFNKVDAKNIADNQLPFLEQASENLVGINNQEVLYIESCFDDYMGDIPIGYRGGIK